MKERQLVADYRKAKEHLELLEKEKSEAQKAFDKVQNELVEYLESIGATATARYEGLGRVSLTKPTLYASVLKENQEQLFSFLESIGRSDLVKPMVHHKTLASFVEESLNEGSDLPEFIKYSFKSTARLTQ